MATNEMALVPELEDTELAGEFLAALNRVIELGGAMQDRGLSIVSTLEQAGIELPPAARMMLG